MHLLKDNNEPLSPEEEAKQKLLKLIYNKEAECLDRVFTRFCLLNGLRIDITKVDPTEPRSVRPNYYEYYYIGPVPKAEGTRHFLMSRELKDVNNEPVLEIIFNKSLIDEDNGE